MKENGKKGQEGANGKEGSNGRSVGSFPTVVKENGKEGSEERTTLNQTR